jgi:hypothetical protein
LAIVVSARVDKVGWNIMGKHAAEEGGIVEAPRSPKRVRNNKVLAGGFAGGCQSQTMAFLVLLASASVGLPLCGAVVSDDSGTLQPLKGAPAAAFATPQSSESNPAPTAKAAGVRTLPLPRRRDQAQRIKAFASPLSIQKHSTPPPLSAGGAQGNPQEPTLKLEESGDRKAPPPPSAALEKNARENEGEMGEEEFVFPKPTCGECETVVRGEWFMGFSKTFCSEACRSKTMERVEGGKEPGWEWYPEFFRAREANERRKRQQAAIQRAIYKQEQEKKALENEQEDLYGMRSSMSSAKIGMDILRSGSGDERRGSMARLVEGG